MNLEEFNLKYKYVSDITQYGRVEHWTVMKPNALGVYMGDCEDYALSIKEYVPQYSDWELWECKIGKNKEGHCVLRNGDEILCCNSKRAMYLHEYSTMFKAIDFKKLSWLRVKIEICKAKILRIFR